LAAFAPVTCRAINTAVEAVIVRLPGQGLHTLIRYFEPDAEEDQPRDAWSLFERSVDPGALAAGSTTALLATLRAALKQERARITGAA